jgi:succinyl-CoA synthetase beta subunit
VRAARPDAPIEGILVQRQEAGLAEAIVGFRRDPVAGPIVSVGVGGVLAELYADVAVRAAPVSPAEAMAMIEAVRGLAPIRGWRGLPRGDVGALAAAIVALSRLAAARTVEEAEINPLIVRRDGEGVSAVDALLVRRNLAGQLDEP